MTIVSPVLPSIDANRWQECERALQERFTAIAESDERSSEALEALIVEAIEVGWTEQEVRRALLDMIRAREDLGAEDASWLPA